MSVKALGTDFFDGLYVPKQSQNSFLPLAEIEVEWMVTHWKEQNILKHWSAPTVNPAAWCSDLLDNALMLNIKCLNEYQVFCWCFLGVKKWPPLPPTNTSPLRRWPWGQGQKFLLAVLPRHSPRGECVSLEHTLTTALAVFLSLIRSWNWLQLPACLVRACKLKQEEKGRSKRFSCAEEGWGMSFMVTLLSFNPQIWSTSDLSVGHGTWQLPCEMWSCCQDGFWTLGWECGVGWAVDLELTRGSGDAGFTLRAVLQLVARWGCCEEEERLPTAAASLRGKQEENQKC